MPRTSTARSARVPRALVVASVLAASVCASVALVEPARAAAPIVVTTTADVVNAGDGVVSLREAITAANAQPGVDTVVLAASTSYVLTICGASGEYFNATGSLDARDGAGIVIQGNASVVSSTCPAADGTVFATGGGPTVLDALTVGSAAGSSVLVGYASLVPVVGTVSMIGGGIQSSGGDCLSVTGTFTVTLQSTMIAACHNQGINHNPATGSLTLAMTDGEVVQAKKAGNPGLVAGAIDATDVTLTRTNVHDNAGGVWAHDTLHAVDSHLDHNNGTIGGALALGPVVATNTTFDDNAATGFPGGLQAEGQLTLSGASVSRNAGPIGGVVASSAAGPVTVSITGAHIDDNVSTSPGPFPNGVGGLYVVAAATAGSSVTLTSTSIAANQAPRVGALAANVATSLDRVSITDNVVTIGGAFPDAGTAVVKAGDVFATHSTIAGNSVPTANPGVPLAGGIAAVGRLDLIDTTVANNAGDVGGVLTVAGGGVVAGSTFVGNVGAVAHDAWFGPDGTTTVVGSALGSSFAAGVGENCALGSASSVTSTGYDFDSGASCGFGTGPGDTVEGGDPKVGPLADNGGPNTGLLTAMPQPGSPLLDRIPSSFTGLCADTDERGTARPQGPGCDIGAVETSVGPGGGYHPVAPTRILDSRTPLGGWSATPLAAGTPRVVAVAGGGVAATVPATASAVVMNVTATGSTAGSFLTVWPVGAPSPTASNLNFAAGETIPNLVTAKVGVGGQVFISTAIGSVDVVADVVGYFDDGTAPGDRYDSVVPARILDSRTTTGGWNGPLVAGGPRDLTVRGVGGVPVTATAVAVNVTATQSTAASFVTVWPTGGAPPNASTLNLAAGQTIPNLAFAKVGAGGQIRFSTAAGAVHLVVDVVGYFDPGAGSLFHAVAPQRVLDDRIGLGASGPWGPGAVRAVPVAGQPGVGADASAIVMNLTATNPSTGSFVTAFPDGAAAPNASNLNVGPGQTIPNLVAVGVGAQQVDLRNELGQVDLVADLVGWFATT